MNWFEFIIQILPSLIALIEKLLGPKTGAAKKEFVMGAAKVAFDTVSPVSTGGQKETWDRIKPFVSTIVDAGVAIAFPKSPGNAQNLIDVQR